MTFATSVVSERQVEIPTRDDVVLRGGVYRAVGDGSCPSPTVMAST